MEKYYGLPILTFVFDRYHRATPTNPGVIELRIAYKGKQKYMSMKIYILPKHWRNGIVTNREDAKYLNEYLQHIKKEVQQVIEKMLNEKGDIDIFRIPQELERLHTPEEKFVDFCRKRVAVRSHDLSADSKDRYNRFQRVFFDEWGEILDIDDIADYSIIHFDDWLKAKGMKPYSRWQNYHRFLNSFIIDAINEGLLTKNPYKSLRLQKDKTKGSLEKHLSRDEVQIIESADLPTKCLQQVRDCFIFQIYTGLAYVDLAEFDVKKIVEVKGQKLYKAARKKTGEIFTVPMLQKALEILAKYDNKLPIISNVKYNLYLKALMQICGIDKPVSSHWARHTCATLMLNGGVPMHIVSKILGHAKIAITESTYAKTLDESIVDAVAEYVETLKNNKN